MSLLHTIVSFLLVSLVAGAAFVPASRPAPTSSALAFGFLKELGLEKPSWLPDFGGTEKEEPPKEPVMEEADEEEGEAATPEE
jgi:hypothetical protein